MKHTHSRSLRFLLYWSTCSIRSHDQSPTSITLNTRFSSSRAAASSLTASVTNQTGIVRIKTALQFQLGPPPPMHTQETFSPLKLGTRRHRDDKEGPSSPTVVLKCQGQRSRSVIHGQRQECSGAGWGQRAPGCPGPRRGLVGPRAGSWCSRSTGV